MLIIVLCTGRCGSTSLYKACRHITNYTSGHETAKVRAGGDLSSYYWGYPAGNHIEIDNRLLWFPGAVKEALRKSGDGALVRLDRATHDTAQSYAARKDRGIMAAYTRGICVCTPRPGGALMEAHHMVHAMGRNLDFITDALPQYRRNAVSDLRLEHIKEDFTAFWRAIGAEGDLDAALKEFDTKHNATKKRIRP